MKILSTIIFLIMSFNLVGQGLKIKKGDQTIEFKENSFFTFSLLKSDDPQYRTPNIEAHLAGFVVNASNDSIQIEVTNFQQITYSHLAKPVQFIHLTKTSNQIMFSKKDVGKFEVYKSEKSYRRKENFLMMGGALTVTGIVTAANFFIFKKSENRNKLLISGGIQLGLGLSFVIYANSYKSYSMRTGKPKWNFKKF